MFIVHRVVFVFNSIAILALLVSYLAPLVSPELCWPIAFAGLAYPVLVMVNVLFILYWAIFFKMKFLFSLAAIVIGGSFIPRYLQFDPKALPADNANSINIITFNARYFGALDNKETEDEKLFYEKLEKINADIFCGQEMYSTNTSFRNSIGDQLQKRYAKYYLANIKLSSGKWITDNIALLSRYPIIKQGIVERNPSSGNYTIFADIVKAEDTIRIITTHLQSIGFLQKEYKALKTLKDVDSIDLRGYKNIASKLKYAFLVRAAQAEQVHDFMKESPYKVIVCGDFNDSPLSYTYKIIRGEMKDAFEEAGSGFGRTYVGAMPSFRIDYILGDPSFEFYNYYAKSFDFSDHKLVSCTVKLR